MKKTKREPIQLPPPFTAYRGEEPYLFVSYCHKDKNRVYPEILRLFNLGYRIWYDEGLEAGAKIPKQLTIALEKSQLFMIFLSKGAVESAHVQREIYLAAEKGMTILPVCLEKTLLPEGLKYYLGGIQSINKFDLPEEQYCRKIEAVLPQELLEDFGDSNPDVGDIENESTADAMTPVLATGDMMKKPYKYHVFISCDNFDENGELTFDGILARKVCTYLTNKGLNIFPNTFPLEKPALEQSRETILAALDASQILVVVGMTLELMNSGDIRYEWERFIKHIDEGLKPDGLMLSYIKNIDSVALPGTLKKNIIITDSNGSFERLYNQIAKTLQIDERSPATDLKWTEAIRKGQTLWLCGADGTKKAVALGDIIRVGRKNDNNLVQDTIGVSRYHAEIVYNPEGLFVRDLQSANGTFVNGTKIAWKELSQGDDVTFDVVSYTVSLSPDKK